MKIVKTENEEAQNIMQKDVFLLDNLKNEPILHLYSWRNPSLTYGYFIDIQKFMDINKAKVKNLSLAKRPTGGGIVFHLWDLAFSFLMPESNKNFFINPLENYKFVNSIVLEATAKFLQTSSFLLEKEELSNNDDKLNVNEKEIPLNFCMAKPTKYDVIHLGKKIVGAAQRKKKNGYLHQGTISLIAPDIEFLNEVLIDKNVAKTIFDNSYCLFPNSKICNIEEKRKIIIENLIKTFEEKVF